MGIITGYICLVSFLLLIAKYIARKSQNSRINDFFAKLHKPVSVLFLIVCIVHLCLVIQVFETRSLFVIFSGFISLGIVLLLIVFCHTMSNYKKKMYWHRLLSIIILVIISIHIVAYFIDFMQYKNKISSIEITDINITKVKDGSYIGDCDIGYIYARVKVVVNSGKIAEIDILEHKNERGDNADRIKDRIIDKQSLKVDAVSGATNSSLVIKKACENALDIKN